MSNIKAGDVGVVLERTLKKQDGTVWNISTATLKKLKVTKAGTTTTLDAEFSSDGSNGKIKYTTTALSFTAGHYQARFYVELGASVKIHSDPFHFHVDAIPS